MLTQVHIREDVIKLIAESAVKTGITLLGGISGVGKTVTSSVVVGYIKDHNLFPADRVFYINTNAEKAAGVDINVAIKDLAAKHAPHSLLIVLDEILYKNAIEMALWLISQGHSVLGVTQAQPKPKTETCAGVGLSSILINIVSWIDEDRKPLVIAAVLDQLNLLILQDSIKPTYHQALRLSPETKIGLSNSLNNDGLYKFYLSVDSLKIQEGWLNE